MIWPLMLLRGNMLCLLSSVVYAVYLILSQRILTAIGAITMLRYTFSGAAVSAIIVTFITGFDDPGILHCRSIGRLSLF